VGEGVAVRELMVKRGDVVTLEGGVVLPRETRSWVEG